MSYHGDNYHVNPEDYEWTQMYGNPFIPVTKIPEAWRYPPPQDFSGFGAEGTVPSMDVFNILRENWMWIAALLLLAWFMSAQQKK